MIDFTTQSRYDVNKDSAVQYVLIETNDIPDIRNVSSLCCTTQHHNAECEYFFQFHIRQGLFDV